MWPRSAYLLDDIARDADPATAARLVSLREHLGGLVGDLRLSIFDLRAGVDESVGLARTLGDYVQRVGSQAGLVVHVSMDESAHRLPVAAEVELLRIVQEAVTNVRKHARAKNLWLTVEVDPPRARITVTDDGRGLQAKRLDSMGIQGMHERAGRIGGQLSVRNRGDGSGTVVEVVIDPPQAVNGRGPRSRRHGRPEGQCGADADQSEPIAGPGAVGTLSDETHDRGRNGSRASVEQEVKVAGDGPRITVLLVDDHQLIREGLRRAFDRAGDLEVVGEAASVASAVDALDRLSPDVLVTDVKLPDGDGIALAQRARQTDPSSASSCSPCTRATTSSSPPWTPAPRRSSARTHPRRRSCRPPGTPPPAHAPSPPATSPTRCSGACTRPTGPKLSPREGEVLELLVDGLVISQIARRLFISESTAKTHVANIYEKLGAGNRAQAVMAAVRLGLVREAGPGRTGHRS